jgi:hypothetical protein
MEPHNCGDRTVARIEGSRVEREIPGAVWRGVEVIEQAIPVPADAWRMQANAEKPQRARFHQWPVEQELGLKVKSSKSGGKYIYSIKR